MQVYLIHYDFNAKFVPVVVFYFILMEILEAKQGLEVHDLIVTAF